MKGVIFSGFLDMLEEEYDYATVNQVIDLSQIPGEGVYTSSGNYPHGELLQMVETLSALKGLNQEEILMRFGHFLFHRFTHDHKAWLEKIEHPFALFEALDSHIHREVRKIHPEAQPPTFQVLRQDERSMELEYFSRRRMEYFALGLIEASMLHYGYPAEVSLKVIGDETVRFKVTIQ